MGKVIQVQFGRQVPAKEVIEAEAKAVEAIAERNIDERQADVLEQHNRAIRRDQAGSVATELLIIGLAVLAIFAVVAATVAFPASVLLGTLQHALNF